MPEEEYRGFDSLDRTVAAALQVNGRASWRSIARCISQPERTVARRGQLLLDAGLVKVSTYLDAVKVGAASPIVITVHTAPGFVRSIAEVIAKRPDASSVSILEGTGEAVSMLIPGCTADRDRLLFEDLPALDGLTGTNASTVLKLFRAGHEWSAQTVTDRRLLALRVSENDQLEAKGSPVELTTDDQRLMGELARNGRASTVSIAEALGLSPATVQRRLTQLLRQGIVHIRTEVPPRFFGLATEALVWMSVPPTEVEQLGRSLSDHPAIRFCAAITGASSLLVDGLFPSTDELFQFLTGHLGSTGEVQVDQVRLVVKAVRRGPLLVAS